MWEGGREYSESVNSMPDREPRHGKQLQVTNSQFNSADNDENVEKKHS